MISSQHMNEYANQFFLSCQLHLPVTVMDLEIMSSLTLSYTGPCRNTEQCDKCVLVAVSKSCSGGNWCRPIYTSFYRISVQGFSSYRGPKIGYSHWLGLSPLQQFSTTVLTLIGPTADCLMIANAWCSRTMNASEWRIIKVRVVQTHSTSTAGTDRAAWMLADSS